MQAVNRRTKVAAIVLAGAALAAAPLWRSQGAHVLALVAFALLVVAAIPRSWPSREAVVAGLALVSAIAWGVTLVAPVPGSWAVAWTTGAAAAFLALVTWWRWPDPERIGEGLD